MLTPSDSVRYAPLLVSVFASITFWTAPISLLLLHPTRAHANEQAEGMLRQAEKQYEQLEYEQALKTLIEVQQVPDLTAIQRARCYLYMGVAFTALGRAENAVQAFMEVLKLRPKFRLPPGVSPSIRAMFGQALKRLNLPEQAPPEDGTEGETAAEAPAEGGAPSVATGADPAGDPTLGSAEGAPGDDEGERLPVDLAARAPAKVLAGRPVTIQIEIDDAKRLVRELVIRWRRRKDPDFSTIRLAYEPGVKQLAGTIPAASLGEWKGRLLYYVEARDSSGNALGRAGSAETPRRLEIGSTEDADGEKSTWYWWVLGVGGAAAAIAGGVLAAVLLADENDDQAKLSITIR